MTHFRQCVIGDTHSESVQVIYISMSMCVSDKIDGVLGNRELITVCVRFISMISYGGLRAKVS